MHAELEHEMNSPLEIDQPQESMDITASDVIESPLDNEALEESLEEALPENDEVLDVVPAAPVTIGVAKTVENTADKAVEKSSVIQVSGGTGGRMKSDGKRRWFIVHTYSGHENKVKVNLERRIESMNMGDKIFRVEVPQKTVTKIKDGKRIEREERVFPGYVLVEMVMDDNSWYVVRYTPGVTKFVGGDKKPIPAKESEIKRILLRGQPTATKVEIDLKVGNTIRIVSGPFADFEGTVTEVHGDKEKLKASVSIFGRETPVELAFNQVQKI